MNGKKLASNIALCLVSASMFCVPFSQGRVVAEIQDHSVDTPVLLVEDSEINVYSKQVSLPNCYVYDSEDVGLSPIVTVEKDGKSYSVLEDMFTADVLGTYNVTYAAVNSRGNDVQKTVQLTLTDTNAPIIKTYGNTLTCFLGKQTKLPPMEIYDFQEVEISATIEQNGSIHEVGIDGFTLTERGEAILRIVVREKKEGGLSTEVNYRLNVINQGAVYGFNDIDESNGIWWGTAQAGNGTSDPDIYQVPIISQNTDEKYVHDGDGKSFKIEIEGKEGMSNSNSWPAVYTSELNFYQAKASDYLVAWVYNAGESALRINMQINGSNNYNAVAVAQVGEWTKLSFPLDDFNGKTASNNITSIKFWISGFVEGKAIYYLDDLYFE